MRRLKCFCQSRTQTSGSPLTVGPPAVIDGAEDSWREAFESLIAAKSFAADAVGVESVPATVLEAYAAYFWGRIVCCERARCRLGAKSKIREQQP